MSSSPPSGKKHPQGPRGLRGDIALSNAALPRSQTEKENDGSRQAEAENKDVPPSSRGNLVPSAKCKDAKDTSCSKHIDASNIALNSNLPESTFEKSRTSTGGNIYGGGANSCDTDDQIIGHVLLGRLGLSSCLVERFEKLGSLKKLWMAGKHSGE